MDICSKSRLTTVCFAEMHMDSIASRGQLHQHRRPQGSISALTPAGLIEVHVDTLQLQVGVAVVGAGGVHAMLITDDLPELGTNLVAALATLDVHDFPHVCLEPAGQHRKRLGDQPGGGALLYCGGPPVNREVSLWL